ncbi:hypothetical protein [Enemella dayhoffiae]|uniref:hypothetical protein n=1 Tax=Enemella dayhoffiae TaxID=2016507 RepID=UPI0015956E1A|nr:hypothetical protein [Enemella dayhoffiae]
MRSCANASRTASVSAASLASSARTLTRTPLGLLLGQRILHGPLLPELAPGVRGDL